MKKYKQLTFGQRYQISGLLKTGISISKIAATIGVNKSTVSRELNWNTPGGGRTAGEYIAEHAQDRTQKRYRLKPKQVCLTQEFKE